MGEPAAARLFVAVWPPDEVVGVIAGLARPQQVGLRWTTREQWHVTLRFLGRCDVDEAKEAFHRTDVAAVGPVVAELGPATERFGRRVLHVPVRGLERLAAAVVAATAAVGEPPEDRAFNGHLTLARARGYGGADLRPLTGAAVEGRWPVTEVTLVASRLGAGADRGARYEVVDRVAVGG